jgi:hypothetical protein
MISIKWIASDGSKLVPTTDVWSLFTLPYRSLLVITLPYLYGDNLPYIIFVICRGLHHLPESLPTGGHHAGQPDESVEPRKGPGAMDTQREDSAPFHVWWGPQRIR